MRASLNLRPKISSIFNRFLKCPFNSFSPGLRSLSCPETFSNTFPLSRPHQFITLCHWKKLSVQSSSHRRRYCSCRCLIFTLSVHSFGLAVTLIVAWLFHCSGLVAGDHSQPILWRHVSTIRHPSLKNSINPFQVSCFPASLLSFFFCVIDFPSIWQYALLLDFVILIVSKRFCLLMLMTD